MKRILPAVLIIAAFSGCSIINRGSSGASPTYQVTTNRVVYSVGNTGEATIKNIASRQLDYNRCQRRLERQVNKYWVVAFEWPTAGGACHTEAGRLPQGDT